MIASNIRASKAAIRCPVAYTTEVRYKMTGDVRQDTNGRSSRADHTPSPSSHKNLRRGERVTIDLPVRIGAVSERGREFLDEGHTVDISRHGATIVAPLELNIGQEIRV